MEEMQEVDKFNYMGVMIITDGSIKKEVAHRVLEERKLWKENIISRGVKRELYRRVVILTVVYDPETWSLSTQERRKIEVVEIMGLRNVCGLR